KRAGRVAGGDREEAGHGPGRTATSVPGTRLASRRADGPPRRALPPLPHTDPRGGRARRLLLLRLPRGAPAARRAGALALVRDRRGRDGSRTRAGAPQPGVARAA